MPFGSNIQMPGVLKPQFTSPETQFRIGSETRRRSYQKKIADAMRGVSRKYENMSREELMKERERLVKLRDSMMGRQQEEPTVEVVEEKKTAVRELQPVDQGVNLFSSQKPSVEEIRRTGRF